MHFGSAHAQYVQYIQIQYNAAAASYRYSINRSVLPVCPMTLNYAICKMQRTTHSIILKRELGSFYCIKTNGLNYKYLHERLRKRNMKNYCSSCKPLQLPGKVLAIPPRWPSCLDKLRSNVKRYLCLPSPVPNPHKHQRLTTTHGGTLFSEKKSSVQSTRDHLSSTTPIMPR